MPNNPFNPIAAKTRLRVNGTLGFMRIAAILLAIGLAVVSTAASAQSREFLSWYDGWGTHTIWGIGKVFGNYSGAKVKCGTRLIPVRAVYDSHEGDPPTADQKGEHLRVVNVALLHRIEAVAGRCIFEPDVK
jgi:hypothetical protein